jgi:predicted N-formylglutamate amidohydrolase
MAGAERILVSCEHAGHRVPRALAPCFAGAEGTLRSHRGWDPGALQLARRLADRLEAPLLCTPVTRLVVDTNRSVHHPRVFSEFTRPLAPEERQAILGSHYWPHRRAIERTIAPWIRAGFRVLHLAVHSFDPTLDPGREACDLGLLYDPRRRRERVLCQRWQAALRSACRLRVRRNYPYRGNADGLTTHLRRQFPAAAYLGIEVEANQAHLVEAPAVRHLARALAETAAVALTPRAGTRGAGQGCPAPLD